jgi:hypothetical protein
MATQLSYAKRGLGSWGQTANVDVYTASATPQARLGFKFEDPFGRRFRYAKGGAVALVQAFMTQTAVQESKMVAIVQTGYAQAAGSKRISVLCTTASASAEDDFAGGWLVCNKVSPLPVGDIYPIISSKLQSTDTILDLELATPWRNAMLVTGEVSLNYNMYFKTIVAIATTITAVPAGVPLCAVPAGYYYWSQTKGPAPLNKDAGDTLIIGAYAGIPATDAVAGTCGNATATGYAFPVYGRVMSIGDDNEPALIDLNLE